jgi:DNA-binding response OmpR family regulator
VNILLVEDDFDVARSVCEYFEAAGHGVEWAPDGLIGLDSATRGACDAILLDIGIPRLSGIELCRRLRDLGLSKVPIMMLTARSEIAEKVAAFEAGADDYVVKPFALAEIASRLRALVRRSNGHDEGAVLRIDDLEFNPATCVAKRGGQSLNLTATGRKLLEALMRNQHRVVPREELERLLWGDSPPASDALKIHIHALREVIDKPFATRLLQTLRGTGYRMIGDGAPQ